MGLFSSGAKRGEGVRFASGRVGYAIGDVHGRADLLVRMLDTIESEFRVIDQELPVVVFLGDYVDRGADSKAVIELLLTRPIGFERRFLKGNHEAAMLAFLEDAVAGRAWLGHGGLETLAAYGVAPLPSLGASNGEIKRAGEMLQRLMPQTHLDFLDRLERYVVFGDYCFVHAGLDPAKQLKAQSDADLFWIRERFLSDQRRLRHRVVHGHTPVEAPYQDGRRIGLDTGAYFSGVLSAARFEGEAVKIIQVR